MKNTFPIRTIILCKGIQASGKTTWTMEQMNKYPGKYKRSNRDLLRAMIDNKKYSPENEKFINNLRNIIVERAIMRNYDVIIDDTNFHEENWESMCAIAKRVGNVRVLEKYFPIDLKTAIERNEKRPEPIPKSSLINFYNKYIKNKKVEQRDEFFEKTLPVYKKENEEKIKAIIVDLDGTLALNISRDYHDLSRILDDVPNRSICDLVRLFHAKKYKIIVVSGRDDSCIEDTKIWLNNYNIPFLLIFMRVTGDNRKDAIVKEEIYRKHIEPHYDVRYVLDDRTQVVNDCWRKLGLCCLQVAPGDF